MFQGLRLQTLDEVAEFSPVCCAMGTREDFLV